MHEWSLASGIIETVTDESSKQKARNVKEIDILVGEISQIDLPILHDALESLKKGTVVEKSEIKMEVERTEMKCRNCGHVWGFEEIRNKLEPIEKGGDNPVHYLPESIAAFVGCPKCGSPDLKVLNGSGIRISKIVMEVEEQ